MISGVALTAAVAGGCGAVAIGDLVSLARVRRARRTKQRSQRVGAGRFRARLANISAAAPGDLSALVEAAGTPGGYSARELMAVKLLLAGVMAIAALGCSAALPSRLSPLLLGVAPAAGFLLPDLLLARRARRRRQQLRGELPAVVDRILLALRAGLPVGRALAEAGAHGGGILAAELCSSDAASKLGVARAAALEQMARRCQLAEVDALVAAIGRADRQGSPLAAALGSLAAGARADNHRRITEQAQGAAPKIQLIVALLLVPAAICCVAAGMIAGLAAG